MAHAQLNDRSPALGKSTNRTSATPLTPARAKASIRCSLVISIGGADSSEGILLSIEVLNQYASGATTDYRLAVVAQTVVDPSRPADADDEAAAS